MVIIVIVTNIGHRVSSLTIMSVYASDFVDFNKGLRLPSEGYTGKTHGFSRPSIETAPGAEPTHAALARHRLAMYFLTQKDTPIPSYVLNCMNSEILRAKKGFLSFFFFPPFETGWRRCARTWQRRRLVARMASR